MPLHKKSALAAVAALKQRNGWTARRLTTDHQKMGPSMITGSRFVTLVTVLFLGLGAGTVGMASFEGQLLGPQGDAERKRADALRRVALARAFDASRTGTPEGQRSLSASMLKSVPSRAVEVQTAAPRAQPVALLALRQNARGQGSAGRVGPRSDDGAAPSRAETLNEAFDVAPGLDADSAAAEPDGETAATPVDVAEADAVQQVEVDATTGSIVSETASPDRVATAHGAASGDPVHIGPLRPHDGFAAPERAGQLLTRAGEIGASASAAADAFFAQLDQAGDVAEPGDDRELDRADGAPGDTNKNQIDAPDNAATRPTAIAGIDDRPVPAGSADPATSDSGPREIARVRRVGAFGFSDNRRLPNDVAGVDEAEPVNVGAFTSTRQFAALDGESTEEAGLGRADGPGQRDDVVAFSQPAAASLGDGTDRPDLIVRPVKAPSLVTRGRTRRDEQRDRSDRGSVSTGGLAIVGPSPSRRTTRAGTATPTSARSRQWAARTPDDGHVSVPRQWQGTRTGLTRTAQDASSSRNARRGSDVSITRTGDTANRVTAAPARMLVLPHRRARPRFAILPVRAAAVDRSVVEALARRVIAPQRRQRTGVNGDPAPTVSALPSRRQTPVGSRDGRAPNGRESDDTRGDGDDGAEITPQRRPDYHIVRSGETLWQIARRYYGKGSDYRRIVAANGSLRGGARLMPKQRLRLP